MVINLTRRQLADLRAALIDAISLRQEHGMNSILPPWLAGQEYRITPTMRKEARAARLRAVRYAALDDWLAKAGR